MVKKIVSLGFLSIAIASVPTMAHSCYFKSGFLAGAHVGVSSGWGRFNSNFDAIILGARTATGKGRETNPMLGIFGGYRHILHNNVTLGFSITADIHSKNEVTKFLTHPFNIPLTFTNTLSRRYSLAPNFNIGKIFWKHWHIMVGLGIGISRFRQNIVSPFSTNATSLSTRKGFIPSLAVEHAASENISILGSINYEIYKKIRKTFDAQSIGAPLAGPNYTSSINPRYLTVKLGAVYRF